MTKRTLKGALIACGTAALIATAAAPSAQAADTFFGNCAADGDMTVDKRVSWIPGNVGMTFNVQGTGRGALNGKNGGNFECAIKMTFARSPQGCVGGIHPTGKGTLTVDGKTFPLMAGGARALPGGGDIVSNPGGLAAMASAYGPSAESLTSCTTFQFDRAVMGVTLQTLGTFKS